MHIRQCLIREARQIGVRTEVQVQPTSFAYFASRGVRLALYGDRELGISLAFWVL